MRERARAHAAGPAKGPVGRLLYAPEGYDASGAQRGLERSLRALNTDYLDVLLLHDPLPGSVRSDEVVAYLEKARTAGLIRSWGIAGEPKPTATVARSFGRSLPILQVRDNILLRSLDGVPTGPTFITFGVLRGALAFVTGHVAADRCRRDRWHNEIGADCADTEVAASFLLQAALKENSHGVVLFCTVNASRIRAAVEAVETSQVSQTPGLDAFLRMVELELRPVFATEGGNSDHWR